MILVLVEPYHKLASYIPFECYSEVDIVLDKDGGKNVAWEVIFRLKKVVLLKILYNWPLRRKERCCRNYMACIHSV